MGEVFLNVLNMSIAASWLILAVMLLRFVLKKAPKWIAVLLWGIVALRLTVPFSFESALSLIPSAETFNTNNIQYEMPAISSGISAVNNAVNPVFGETFAPNPVGSVNPLYVWTLVVSVIWLIGIAAMLLYAVISYVQVRRSVAERVPYEGNIFLCDHVKSPFILGLVVPKIYLPSNMDTMAMDPVIAHEKAHLARRDHWWKPIGFLILTVHWFNPLCWIAYVLLCRDIELACDEKVIQQMDLDGKKQYSTALLECSTGRRLVTICPLAFGEVGVKERVRNVLNYKKPAFWVIVVAIIACAVVTVCFATNPVVAEPSTPDGNDAFDGQKLTLDDVVMLSQKGDALSWSDFEQYQGQEIGSGLYIMRYEIDELFEVRVGGVPNETPWYIYLRVNNGADDRIDIRTENVSAFIEAHRNDVPKIVDPIPDGGGEPAPEEPDFSNSDEIFDVLERLDYQAYTCDGLPEYLLTATDGTVYSINISEKWIWRGNNEQAELSDELIARLKEDANLTQAEYVAAETNKPNAEIPTEMTVPADTPQAPTIEPGSGTMENMTGIFAALNKLDYQPYTCDGLPEYRLFATDGTMYFINFSENWVWRGNSEQAELSAELISQLKESGMLIAEEGPLETP